MNELLLTAWNLHESAERVEGLGINNEIWRVGTGFWLTRVGQGAADRLRREAALYGRLNALAAEAGSALRVPSVVPTVSGEPYYNDGTALWRLTRHLPGVHPDRTRLESFIYIAEGLGELDTLLVQIPDSFQIYQGPNWLDSLEQNLAEFQGVLGGEDFLPEETDLGPMQEAAAIVASALPRFRSEPQQLIHGDAYPPNVKVRSESDPMVVGFLDFEFCAAGPRVLEVAPLILGMRNHSDEEVRAVMDEVIAAYKRKAGSQIDRDLLDAALVSYKFNSYLYHRGRVVAGTAPGQLMEGRLDSVRRLLLLIQR